ncbi:hypothetical protein AC789_145pl00800 (plasmid) [Escherichia coli]|uniref:Uncharacterized protein n=2 Tax=Escherichia coli TaxID=562 RepID=A0A075MER7_ECOLX|nr:hypothetical protein [Escherichia coli]AJE59098.1 hypothetical protein AC789_145pl00800 [Escherichia coli]
MVQKQPKAALSAAMSSGPTDIADALSVGGRITTGLRDKLFFLSLCKMTGSHEITCD